VFPLSATPPGVGKTAASRPRSPGNPGTAHCVPRLCAGFDAGNALRWCQCCTRAPAVAATALMENAAQAMVSAAT
jgi:hypothetical protein